MKEVSLPDGSLWWLSGGRGKGCYSLVESTSNKAGCVVTKHQAPSTGGKLGEVRVLSVDFNVDFGMKMAKVGSGAEQTQHMDLARISSSCLVVEWDKQSCDDEIQGIRHHNPGKDQLRVGQVPT